MVEKRLFTQDLAHIATNADDALGSLTNASLFITGGTGFFGQWLLESLVHANREFDLNIRVCVLSRLPERFRQKCPHLANDPAISLHAGDVRSFEFPGQKFTHIIHAAADSIAPASPAELAGTIVEGTRRVLQLAEACDARRVLYVSSGAVYGRSATVPYIPETYAGVIDPLSSTNSYDESKRIAEQLCLSFAESSRLEPVLARCFAFVGPHLPLDQHFAIGNFLRAAIDGDSVEIHGDGTPWRSWLYMADLAVWLWTLLVRGQSCRAYNVGSDEAYTIAAAANLVARTLRPDGKGGSALPVHVHRVADPAVAVNQYVPSIERARQELGLNVRVPLAEAVLRTARWHGFPA